MKEYLQMRILPAEILGNVSRFPHKDKDGQIHLFKSEWRALVAMTPGGPLVLMSWVVWDA